MRDSDIHPHPDEEWTLTDFRFHLARMHGLADPAWRGEDLPLVHAQEHIRKGKPVPVRKTLLSDA